MINLCWGDVILGDVKFHNATCSHVIKPNIPGLLEQGVNYVHNKAYIGPNENIYSHIVVGENSYLNIVVDENTTLFVNINFCPQ